MVERELAGLAMARPAEELRASALARVLEAELERVGHLEVEAKYLPLEDAEAVQATLREAVDLALAMVRLPTWIFFLFADPKDSPHAKGGETTLEPYLTV